MHGQNHIKHATVLKYVDAGGSGVEGVGLQPLDCWNRGLEIH